MRAGPYRDRALFCAFASAACLALTAFSADLSAFLALLALDWAFFRSALLLATARCGDLADEERRLAGFLAERRRGAFAARRVLFLVAAMRRVGRRRVKKWAC